LDTNIKGSLSFTSVDAFSQIFHLEMFQVFNFDVLDEDVVFVGDNDSGGAINRRACRFELVLWLLNATTIEFCPE
jgi:hypothetical protein